ncbi:hypothetical protein M758_UG010700 [Ceratodon purpureus]|nr:hypothetical protein M758_UG010700 [Ceratodon purpureus]
MSHSTSLSISRDSMLRSQLVLSRLMGSFELMKYRITEGINLPFRVLPSIKELGRTRLEVNVKVKSVFGAKMFALGAVVKVPVPKHIAKASFQVTSDRAKYNAAIDCLVWKVRKFPGQTELTMSAEVELISTMIEKKSWSRSPIQMEFQVCGNLRTCSTHSTHSTRTFVAIFQVTAPLNGCAISQGLVHMKFGADVHRLSLGV